MDQVAVDADDAVGRAGHAEVGDVGGAARQHALVGGLHVAVRAHHRAHPPVEVPAHAPATRTSPRSACPPGRSASPCAARGTISSALRNGQSIGGMNTRPMRLRTATLCGPAFTVTCPTPGVPDGKVGRPQEQVLLRDVLDDLLPVPDVVAGGHHVHALLEDGARDLRRDAEAGGGVLDVDDREVDVVLLAQPGQERLAAPARPARRRRRRPSGCSSDWPWLLRHFDGARLADDDDLDVPGVLHLGLDALGDVLGELMRVEVGDDCRPWS